MKKILFYFFFAGLTFAQPNFVSVINPVYSFLEKLSVKGVFLYSPLILPKTRTEIANYLSEIYDHKELLSQVEYNNLLFYLEEYSLYDKRWNLYSYSDSMFSLTVNPQLGAKLVSSFGERVITKWTGIDIYSSFADNWGFQMNYRDHSQQGESLDRNRSHDPETGIQILGGSANSIEYSEMQGAVSFQNRYITAALGKGFFKWGSGYNSRLILSDKSPSFPYFRLDFHPTEWLNFYFVHGWLNSRVIDSTESYSTTFIHSDSSSQYRWIERSKFYSAHILEFIPWKSFRVSIGESIVYSDQEKPGYIIPVMFFRLADHYYEGQSGFGKGGNSQFFIDVNWSFMNRCKLFGSLFIDELSLTNLLKGKNDRNQLGYTIGGSAYDILPNLLLRFEYTRILPWVYSNFIQTQTYTNSGYLMGHYIGQNADQLYIAAEFSPFRRTEIKFWGEFTRRGGTSEIKNQYNAPGEDFLYGLRRNDYKGGGDLSYEYTHDLFTKFSYAYSNTSDENSSRTPLWQLGSFHNFNLTIQYGL